MTQPFADAAPLYRSLGWSGVLWFRPFAKHPPPSGFTGNAGGIADDAQVQRWLRQDPAGNVGLRLPLGIIGIDVDAYGDKNGAATLDQAEQHLGPLPPTWSSTARDDGVSGIRWFRVPEVKYIDRIPPANSGIEIIQHHHRYAIVAPSVHPETGTEYRWHEPGGAASSTYPKPTDLAELTQEWVDFLRRDENAGDLTGPVPQEDQEAPSLGGTSSWFDLVRVYAERVRTGAPRNDTAKDLIIQLRDNRCPRGDALQVYGPIFFQLLGGLANTLGADGEPYEPAEWSATVHSIYARPAREPLPGFAGLGAASGSGVEGRAGAADGTIAEGTPVPADFVAELNETGNAQRFVTMFVGRALYVPGLGWHLWDGSSWRADELDDTLDMTKHVLRRIHAERMQAATEGDEEQRQRLQARFGKHYDSSARVAGRKAMLAGAASDPHMKYPARLLDIDPYLLTVKNGTLNLRTQEVRESQPHDFNTRVAAVDYDRTAEAPQWREHMRLIAQHENGAPDPAMEAFLQRWAGYTLTGLVSEQKFIFCYGEGSNGKNVFIETLLGILGDYGMRGSSKILMASGLEHETIIADLTGVRMVFIDETPQGRVNEARIKELTGSERIRARKMRQDTFEFDARFKLWIAGNNKPRVVDVSEGFWRRLDLTPFDAVIPKDRRIRDYQRVLLATERAGILNWCLEGLRGYLELGELAEPERVRAASHEYREEENVFGQMVAECFMENDEQRIWYPNNVLHWIYRSWAERNGLKREQILGMQQLANDWRRAGFERDPTTRKFVQGWPAKKTVQRGYFGPITTVELPVDLRWANA